MRRAKLVTVPVSGCDSPWAVLPGYHRTSHPPDKAQLKMPSSLVIKLL